MSKYTLDLFFVGTDVDDALESLPFLEQDHAETFRESRLMARREISEFYDASEDELKIYTAEITFDLSMADITEVTA